MYKHIRILLYKLAISTDPVCSIFSKFVYDQDLWTQFAFFKLTIFFLFLDSLNKCEKL